MKVQRTILLTDTIAQGILISLIIPGPLLSLWGNNEWLFISLYGMVFLGAWQFLGNFLWMALTKEKSRRRYFWGVCGYFLLGIFFSRFLSHSTATEILGISYWLVLPFGIAIHYFWISATQLVADFRTPRSFWDL